MEECYLKSKMAGEIARELPPLEEFAREVNRAVDEVVREA